MKKLLVFLLIICGLHGMAQTPIQKVGAPKGRVEVLGQSITDSIFWPTIRDTTFIPNFEGAIDFRPADRTFYGYSNGAWRAMTGIWGQITGQINNQIDLRDSLRARQYAIVNTYGIVVIGGQPVWDSAHVRKVDTFYRKVGVDSLYYTINGAVRAVLDSAGGTGPGGPISGAGNLSPLFTTGVSGPNITFAAINQASNLIYAGPVSGGAAVPTFRALTLNDLPIGIPNSSLANSNIGFAVGNSGVDVGWVSPSVSLGNTAILNIPSASATNRGVLLAADWTTFNNKVQSVNGLFGVVVTKNADSIKKLPIDTTSNRNGYVLAFDSLNHKWYLAPGGAGGGTTYTIGALDGNGAGAQGLTISGSSIYPQSASVSAPGLVNNTTQSFSGSKTFTGTFKLTGLTQKTPVAGDSALLVDVSGQVWKYYLGPKVNISDTSAMLAPYLRSVTSLSPLFTTTIASHVATLALNNANAHTFFGNFTSSAGAPSYSSPLLASADFLNQGTTTSVLHGNAAGNPSWGQVALASDVSGILGKPNGGTGTATPALVGGYGILITNPWPNSTVTLDTAHLADTLTFRNLGATGVPLSVIINSNTIGFPKLYFRNNLTATLQSDSSWIIDAATGGGSSLVIGTLGSVSPSADGAVISGGFFYNQYASQTFPGLVKATGPQTIGATLTFSAPPAISTETANGGPFFGDAGGVIRQAAAGTAVQVFHGGTVPSFGAVNMSTDVSNILAKINGGNGTATPTITAGAGISVTGSWGAYTITSTGAGSVTTVSSSGGTTGFTLTTVNPTTTPSITLGGVGNVSAGGTGLASLSPFNILVGGSTATGNVQQVASVGSSGQFLGSNGAGALPSFKTIPTPTLQQVLDAGSVLTHNNTITTGTNNLIINGGGVFSQQNTAGTYNWGSVIGLGFQPSDWNFGYLTNGSSYNNGTIDIDSNMNIYFPANLTISKGLAIGYTPVSATYNILSTDYTVDATSGTFTETLPLAANTSIARGKIYVLKNSGAGVITLATSGGQTIDGSANQILAPGASLTVQSNGSNWIILSGGNTQTTSGSYTPTVVGTINVSSSIAKVCYWTKIGNIVTVTGKANITPTSTIITNFTVSLPVASTLAADDLDGLANSGTGSTNGGTVSPSGNLANVGFVATSTGAQYIYFTYSYIVH